MVVDFLIRLIQRSRGELLGLQPDLATQFSPERVTGEPIVNPVLDTQITQPNVHSDQPSQQPVQQPIQRKEASSNVDLTINSIIAPESAEIIDATAQGVTALGETVSEAQVLRPKNLEPRNLEPRNSETRNLETEALEITDPEIIILETTALEKAEIETTSLDRTLDRAKPVLSDMASAQLFAPESLNSRQPTEESSQLSAIPSISPNADESHTARDQSFPVQMDLSQTDLFQTDLSQTTQHLDTSTTQAQLTEITQSIQTERHLAQAQPTQVQPTETIQLAPSQLAKDPLAQPTQSPSSQPNQLIQVQSADALQPSPVRPVPLQSERQDLQPSLVSSSFPTTTSRDRKAPSAVNRTHPHPADSRPLRSLFDQPPSLPSTSRQVPVAAASRFPIDALVDSPTTDTSITTDTSTTDTSTTDTSTTDSSLSSQHLSSQQLATALRSQSSEFAAVKSLSIQAPRPKAVPNLSSSQPPDLSAGTQFSASSSARSPFTKSFPAKSLLAQSAKATPTIEITIGRIEMRVTSPPTRTATPSPKQRSRSPGLSLSDYLEQRNQR